MREPFPLFYWKQSGTQQNFGEGVLVEFLKHYQVPIRWVPESQEKKYITVNSSLERAKPGDTIWGTGIAYKNVKLKPHANYRAVRGPITQAYLREAGISCPVIGDPILLAPLFMKRDIYPTQEKIGILPHWSNHGELSRLARSHQNRAVIPIMSSDTWGTARAIWSCTGILSTSLHAMVFAHAYGIPAAWGVIHGKVAHGDGTKYKDYLQSVGLDKNPVTIDEVLLKRDFTADLYLPKQLPDLDLLMKVCPFFDSSTND